MAGEYRLRKKLGEGGYGAVYEAEHPLLKRRAAVQGFFIRGCRHRFRKVCGASSRQHRQPTRSQSPHPRHLLLRTMQDRAALLVMGSLGGEPLDRYMDRERAYRCGRDRCSSCSPIARRLDLAPRPASVAPRSQAAEHLSGLGEERRNDSQVASIFGMAKLLGQSSAQTVSGPCRNASTCHRSKALGRRWTASGRVRAGLLCHEL